MQIEIVELGTDEAKKIGNASKWLLAVLRRECGQYTWIHNGGGIGTVRRIRDGKCFDWWICEDQTVCVTAAE